MRLADFTDEQLDAFFDRLDETPQHRGGGYIVSLGPAEFRSRPAPRFPRLERRQRQLAEIETERDRRSAWLEMTGRLLEIEEQL
jgi:hypothetical protein